MRRADLYQLSLIVLGTAAAAMFWVFLSRELFPEYKIYQEDYIALEKFRSSYTHEPSPPFVTGVKQIVMEKENKGPPDVDRCVSCHVALQFSHFSPTKIARDLNGNIIRDEQGTPIQITNEDYVWAKVDQRIRELTDPEKLAQMRSQGHSAAANNALKEATNLESLKEVRVGNQIYDVTKVLAMHPLIGKETRPFEFHPLEEYGCVSCHNGNGRGLTTEKAHGPVFDDQYEIEFLGNKPIFTESDPENDPAFARMFNDKPGPNMLFQTTPIFSGPLIQAKCLQCHQSSSTSIVGSLNNASAVTEQRMHRANAIKDAYSNERDALLNQLKLKFDLETKGYQTTLTALQERTLDYTLPSIEHDQATAQLSFLNTKSKGLPDKEAQKALLLLLNKSIEEEVGSSELQQQLQQQIKDAIAKGESPGYQLNQFIEKHLKDNPQAVGTLFKKAAAWDLEQQIMRHVQDTETSLTQTVEDQTFLNSISSDLDLLTRNYNQGLQLYLSQACYACHRISGFARGGVGPELTRIGTGYPWYIKESIVWPQADLPTSTMPNFRMDHEELQDLMAFLLAQTGKSHSVSETGYKIAVQEWEAGKKSPWEKPVTPAQMHDLRFGMTVFATEGCAACHRLQGFESNVGFAVEKEKKNESTLYQEREWFSRLIPEMIIGSELVNTIEKNQAEIDRRIVNSVREGSIIEEIEKSHPESVEALYTPFKYASRAKNHFYDTAIANEQNPDKREQLQKEAKQWKERVHRVLMMFIQEYGMGRLICPRPNWSGVNRTDEWLMEHFRNPSSHVAKSIMPVFPFDDTKFYSLTYMLDVLGKRNRDFLRKEWDLNGFNPEQAYHIFCSQCHGEFRGGNGPIAEWIYPIPKNLRNADFLRNLTKARVIYSITHGVKGTPMPPWGEVAKDKQTADGIPILNDAEIEKLTDWLFSQLPGERVIRGVEDVPKWQYSPSDVLKELQEEGNKLNPSPQSNLLKTAPQTVAAVETQVPPDGNISRLFDVVSNPLMGPDQYLYYIKKDYFTDYNIDKGRQFFEMNCAVCHGKEGDGSGIRAGVMKDAKPRMFTNLDWIATRDDLRLLRSIKYGVPGTAMTPWGDFTSSLQRLQLVIFIRSLTQDRQQREGLFSLLYKAFETAQLYVENARIEEYKSLEKIRQQYESVQSQRTQLYSKVGQNHVSTEESTKLYQQEITLLTELKKHEETDARFLTLKNLIKQEQDLYLNLGLGLLTKDLPTEILDHYRSLLTLKQGRYTLEKGTLQLNADAEKTKQSQALQKQILDTIKGQIKNLDEERNLAQSKYPSPERTQELTHLNTEIKGLEKLQNSLISDFEQARRLEEKQNAVYQQLQEKIKPSPS